MSGVEPLTFAVQKRYSTTELHPLYFFKKTFKEKSLTLHLGWDMLDLNQRPHPYQGCALPLS